MNTPISLKFGLLHPFIDCESGGGRGGWSEWNKRLVVIRHSSSSWLRNCNCSKRIPDTFHQQQTRVQVHTNNGSLFFLGYHHRDVMLIIAMIADWSTVRGILFFTLPHRKRLVLLLSRRKVLNDRCFYLLKVLKSNRSEVERTLQNPGVAQFAQLAQLDFNCVWMKQFSTCCAWRDTP